MTTEYTTFDDSEFHSPPPMHELEEERLFMVRGIPPYKGPEDGPMKSIARQAAALCKVPFAMVSLMEEREQQFLACVGASDEPVAREETFCAYCILQSEPMVVENALDDPRFKANPHVVGDRSVRFYVGAPILDGGLPLGTVCVIDTVPHEVSSQCLLAMERLAERAAAVLRLRQFVVDRQGPFASADRVNATMETLNTLLMPLVDR